MGDRAVRAVTTEWRVGPACPRAPRESCTGKRHRPPSGHNDPWLFLPTWVLSVCAAHRLVAPFGSGHNGVGLCLPTRVLSAWAGSAHRRSALELAWRRRARTQRPWVVSTDLGFVRMPFKVIEQAPRSLGTSGFMSSPWPLALGGSRGQRRSARIRVRGIPTLEPGHLCFQRAHPDSILVEHGGQHRAVRGGALPRSRAGSLRQGAARSRAR